MRHLRCPLVCWLLLAPLFAFAQSIAPSVASITRSQTVNEGDNVTLTVSADGTAPFTFQWRKDGAAITGATSSSYALNPIRTTDAGSYTVAITNPVGTTISDPVLIAVTPATPPEISYYSRTVDYTIGQTLYVSVSVWGTHPLTYVWRKDGTVIAGATSSTYSKASATADDAGVYRLTVSNLAGTVESEAITVTARAAVAPSFNSQPANILEDPGAHRWVSYSVNGTQPLKHELLKGETVVRSSEWGSLSFSSLSTADEGTYHIRVSNTAGTALSEPFTVKLKPARAPKLSISSATVNLVAGQSLYLSGYLSDGTAPVTYQWYKDSVALTGATDYYYSKSNAQSSDAGNYTLTVKNSQGESSATVNVSITGARAPQINRHPHSASYRTDEWVSLSVSAIGDQLTFQWKKDGVAIAGATSAYHHLTSRFGSSHVGTYTVEVKNALGSTVSEPAELTLQADAAPVILLQPVGQTVEAGESFGLNVQTSSHPLPTYQWSKDGAAIAGANSAYYWVNAAAASDGGTYSVKLTNSVGSATSADAVVQVAPLRAPVITQHPASASVLPGDYHQMAVQVFQPRGATYEWKRDGTTIPQATSSSLYISGAQPSDAGTYTCTVTNAVGTVTSEAAVLRVDTHKTRPVIIFSNGSSASITGQWVYYSIATSVTPLSTQWKLNGVTIPGFTSTSVSFTASAAAVGVYRAVVTTAAGTEESPPITFTLLAQSATPVIRQQPGGTTVEIGSSTGFAVQVSGEGPFTYQWRKNGTAIPLATSSQFYLNSVVADDAGTYTVVVTNAGGSVTSHAAELALRPASPPLIVRHPASMAVNVNDSSFGLEAYVSGSQPFTYQWQKDGVNLPNATNNYLYHTSNKDAGGRYRVIVKNAHGTATSKEATITLVSTAVGPTFTSQPASLSVHAGSTATFSAVATGRGTLSYQWRKNGTAIAGATSSTLTLSAVKASDEASYTLMATDADGAASSQPATLKVQVSIAPSITGHPSDAYVTAGSPASFSASATGTPAPAVQWHRNGSPIGGATGATLSLGSVTVDQAGSYTLVATNAAGSATSRAATLHVLSQPAASPVITTQPRSVTINPGHTATFTVEATGSPAPAYQWRKDNAPIGGANAATLTLDAVQANQAGAYSVEVSNAFGAVVSQEAQLQVGAVVTGVYLGTIGPGGTGGSWALLVMSDQTGHFLAVLPERNQAIVVAVTVGADGRFTFGQTINAEADGLASTAARYYVGPGQGTINGGTVTGTLSALNLSFSGTATAPGATAANAGYYQAVPSYTAAGAVYAIATPDGRSFGVVVDSAAVFGGAGTLTNGQIEVRAGAGAMPALTAALDPARSTLSGQLHFSGRAPVTVAPAAIPSGSERLVNLSTRARAGGGSDTLIAGFVITGNDRKSVLVRAAGPALIPHQVVGAMVDPVLHLYQGDQKIFDNDNWEVPSKAMIEEAVNRVGAFPFAAGSKDSAILMGLNPGVYSAHVTSTSSTTSGVALIEVYEYSGSASAPRLLNLSARSPVGRGDDILIVGLVVTGDAPKRYLIRGVGPTLTDFKVTGVLQNPRLQLFRGKDLVRENDDWSSGGDAGDIAAAAAATGAFALPAGSKDAALLVYLPPGAYTAHVSGVGDTTGVALIEAYEVP